MTKLHISGDLSLPLGWITLATVVYGARGSGKTTFGSVVAEEVAKAKQRFCAIDLKGDWYGLKSSRDGKADGLPVVVFGGDHADLPLEEGAGAFIAETIASLAQSTILDFEHFSKGKQIRFQAEFFETLYHRNRDPLLLLMDEAQRYAPQKPMSPDEARCLGAVQDMVKLGRKHGLGPVLFTQRGSGLNKEVSELCDVLVAFRTPGPLDQDRIKDWLDANTTKAQRDEVMGQLSGLKTGTAVFASGHPDLKVFGVHTVRHRETFDSSATPQVGKPRAEPKRLAQPDLEALKVKLADAITRAKLEDPKELRRQLADQKKALETTTRELERLKAKPAPVAPAGKTTQVDVDVLRDTDRELLRALRDEFLIFSENIADKADVMLTALADRAKQAIDDASRQWTLEVDKRRVLFVERLSGTRLQRILDKLERTSAPQPVPTPRTPPPSAPLRREPLKPRTECVGDDSSDRGISNVGQLILDALAELELLKSLAPARELVALLAGYSNLRSKGFTNAIGALRTSGYIDYPSTETIALTESGRGAATWSSSPSSSKEIQARVIAVLKGKSAEILRPLIEAHPSALPRDEVAALAGYENLRSKGFVNAIGRLRTLGFVRYPDRSTVAATDILFL